MVNDKAQKIPDPETEWEIWYQDTFDRECPRQIEISGRGLESGLVELWARHLLETVTASGGKGFSRFNLWCKYETISIEILGEWGGQVRLRGWVYGGKKQAGERGAAKREKELLKFVAAAHKNLILEGKTSDAILALAAVSEKKEDFKNRIVKLD